MLVVPDLLSAAEIQELSIRLATATFIPGRTTASGSAAEVKDNLQLDSNQHADILSLITDAIHRSQQLQDYVRPRTIRRPLIARYETGMMYGLHMDNPIMGQNRPSLSRSDVSMTLFLNDPESYDGGDLVLMDGSVRHMVKLPAGHAFVYPTDYLHSVSEVVEGQRLVAVTWFQSHVRDHQERLILYRLKEMAEILGPDIPSRAKDIWREIYAKLTRRWSDV